jgi:GNAT superfamily N-acetyltransferase
MTAATTGASGAPVEAARRAADADLAAVADLATELRSGAMRQRGGPLWVVHEALPAPTVAELSARLRDPRVATIVGTLDDVVLAYGLAHLTEVRDGRTLAVIDELLVAEPARAVGLGEAVLAALVAWATDHGALGVDATALPGDRTAKNFFEAAGFTARRLVMHAALRPDET